jgi:hypothetical protein
LNSNKGRQHRSLLFNSNSRDNQVFDNKKKSICNNYTDHDHDNNINDDINNQNNDMKLINTKNNSSGKNQLYTNSNVNSNTSSNRKEMMHKRNELN